MARAATVSMISKHRTRGDGMEIRPVTARELDEVVDIFAAAFMTVSPSLRRSSEDQGGSKDFPASALGFWPRFHGGR